jgi:hypothetical protein
MDADEGAPGFKVLLLGDSGVGKTSLTQLICHRKPELDPPYTVGCQVQIRSTHCTHAHSRQALNCHAPCPCRFTLCSLVVVPSCTLTTCPHASMSTALRLPHAYCAVSSQRLSTQAVSAARRARCQLLRVLGHCWLPSVRRDTARLLRCVSELCVFLLDRTRNSCGLLCYSHGGDTCTSAQVRLPTPHYTALMLAQPEFITLTA